MIYLATSAQLSKELFHSWDDLLIRTQRGHELIENTLLLPATRTARLFRELIHPSITH